ncbi:MAG: VOC family protein [Armatimonadota bacterium]
MTFEHMGLNVPDAPAMAQWYVEHLNMRIIRKLDTSPFTHFLADESGRPLFELYTNPTAEIPDYPNRLPLVFHVGLAVDDPQATSARLQQAGASEFLVENLADGSLLIMMRDPWGVALQLCKRVTPLA